MRIEYRWAEGQSDRLQVLTTELLHQRAAVIAAFANSAAQAAKAATTTIPIVFSVGDDPVRLGLVASLAQPGGNATGINSFTTELASKRLELLREMVPVATRLVVLVSSSTAVTFESTVRNTSAGARAMGLQVQVLNADTSSEIDAAFARLARERCDALYVDSIPFFLSRRVQLVNLASRLAVPAIYFDRAFAEIGGLMSYGAGLTDVYRQVGVYAALILKGTKPADLPVVQSSKRAGHQSPNRPDAWPHRAAGAHRHRRRGDRIIQRRARNVYETRSVVCSRQPLVLNRPGR